MPFARGAVVLQYAKNKDVRENVDLVRFLCLCNMNNWGFVSEGVQSDPVLFSAMLDAPWNGPDSVEEHVPPLALAIGSKRDCNDRDRVLAAVQQSSYNIRFVSKRLLCDPAVLAWAGAPKEVKAITEKEALAMHREFDAILHADGSSAGSDYQNPACLRAALSFTKRKLDGRPEIVDLRQSRMVVYSNKIGMFFRIPPSVRCLLWPTLPHCEPSSVPATPSQSSLNCAGCLAWICCALSHRTPKPVQSTPPTTNSACVHV